MDLYDYFFQQKKENGMMQADLADRIGVSVTGLSLIMHGHRAPTFKLARQIEIATENKVSFIDMMKHYYLKKTAQTKTKNKSRPGRKRIMPQPQPQPQPSQLAEKDPVPLSH